MGENFKKESSGFRRMGESPWMGVLLPSDKLQWFLSVYVDHIKMAACQRFGQHCQRKSIWTTQCHSLIRNILDVLSEQHKKLQG